MKIAHICNNYVSSKVHLELIKSISKNSGNDQYVYVPVRSKKFIDVNRVDDFEIKYFNYSFDILKYFPLIKILINFIAFILYGFHKKGQVVIAHNFWSDGVLAFFNYIFFKKPYILVVRNTDINVFIPKLKHYHWLMALMIKNSHSLVFVNKSYMRIFEEKYNYLYNKSKRIELIYNGVNEFWLQEFEYDEKRINNSLIYVGSFNKNKNIQGIVEACDKVFKRRPDLQLYLVGGNIKDLKSLLNIDVIPPYIHVLGKIDEKEKLLKLYKKSMIFIMPSFLETFGLVYVEALLQGCSIIHSKGQGIDGIFYEDFIKAVDPKDISEIAEKIVYLLDTFDKNVTSSEFYSLLKNLFDWNIIAQQYLRILEN